MSGDELRNEFRAFYPTARDLEPKLDGWVQAFPQSYVARLARGIYFKRVGLEERGGEYISKTSRQQLSNMDSALEKAIRDFGTSIPMEKKPFLSYLHMMDISSQYVGVAYTRQLYDKAVALSASSFGLRLKLMRSLGAKWGGGLQMMEAFMTECRLAHLPDSQLNQLQAMVYEDEGWEDVNYRNDLAGAEVAYRKALEQVPGECESCVHPDVGLILVLMKLGKFPDAIEYLDAYLRSHPDDLWGLANRGESYMESGNGRSAIADWSRAANAGDDYSQYHLGVAYLQGVPGVLEPDKKCRWRMAAQVRGPGQPRRDTSASGGRRSATTGRAVIECPRALPNSFAGPAATIALSSFRSAPTLPANPREGGAAMRYEISGTIMQTVAVDLEPGEALYSQTNCMAWMSDNIQMNTHTGGGLFAGIKRSLSGGSLFIH